MKLYHGGSLAVSQPQVISPKKSRPLDFGSGFYTTTSLEQARRWIRLRSGQDPAFGRGIISTYELDDCALKGSGLKILRFSSDDLDSWFDFVMANRHTPDFTHDYDLVVGPVANDRVFMTLTLFESGLLDKAQAILQLKTYTLWDQYLFHTAASLKYLKFIGTVE